MASFNVAGWQLSPSGFAFVMCLLVVFIDMMGNQFLGPVLTPYGLSIGLQKTEIASLFSATAAGQVVSSFMLPMLSDRKGRKLAIIVSVVGSIFGYLIQGLAFIPDYPGSYGMLIGGKALAGLFAGTMPVTTAYITELSLPNMDLLKTRMTTLVTVQQQGGTLLGPVAGSISSFGLHIPFLIAAGTALFGLPFVAYFFRNADEIKAMEVANAKGDQAAVSATDKPQPAQAPPKPKGLDTPFVMDLVMNCYCICYCCIGMVTICIPPLFTFLFLFPVYDIQNLDDPEQEQKRVAQVVSLCLLPFSICQGFFMMFVFAPLSRKIGDGKCAFFAGVIATMAICGIAVLAHFSDPDLYTGDFKPALWMTCICLAVFGSALGILVPLLVASGPRYRGLMYPHRLGAAGAYCQRGIFGGMFLGNPCLIGLYEATNLRNAFFLFAGLMFLFYILFAISDRRARAKIAAKLAADKKKTDVENRVPEREACLRDALPEEEFIKKAQTLVEDLLRKRNYALWSCSDQALAEAQLSVAFAQLAEWKDTDSGHEHNVGVLRRLRELGENAAADHLAANAPDVAADDVFNENETLMFADLGDAGPFMRQRSGISHGGTPSEVSSGRP